MCRNRKGLETLYRAGDIVLAQRHPVKRGLMDDLLTGRVRV
jgi:hypothetical protein